MEKYTSVHLVVKVLILEKAYRCACGADRTGHALLHPLFGQAMQHNTRLFVKYFALDLIMNSDSSCKHGRRNITLVPSCIYSSGHRGTGYGRAYFSTTSAHTCTGDGNAMVARAGLPLKDLEFVQCHPRKHEWS
ncbi:hypothetical protein QYF36_019661 [Acer negundo]|nr:hypothetical protein QYF36_019661 [Acer negundo]